MKKLSWKLICVIALIICIAMGAVAVFGFTVYKLNTKINNLSLYTE